MSDRKLRHLTVDGRRVACFDTGDAPGTPLLCLHGWTGSKEDYAPVLPALAADRRVVVPDLPGHQDSAGPDDEAAYALGGLVRWVLALVDALGVGELHLLGHSLGGLLAQRVAAAASQRLRSLVLMGTGLGTPREEVGDRVAAIALAARERGLAAAFELSQTLNVAAGRPVDADRAPANRERFLRLQPAALIGGARALLTAAPPGPFLRGIDVPVLVVHGEAEPVWEHPDQALLAASIRGARRVVIPGAEHSPQQDQPAALVAVLTPFLAAADP